MFRCIGRYGNYDAYEIYFGESETIESLLSLTIRKMNSLKPKESIHFYVYEDDLRIGRFMREDHDDITCYLRYVPNEEITEFVEKKKIRLGII